MVTIAGNGMGPYDFTNLNCDTTQFDVIICDKNFTVEGGNILKYSFKEAKEYLLSNFDKQNILYVVTGSPLFFSAGTLLANKLPKESLRCINNTSCQEYLLNRLFIAQTEVSTISLHGKSLIDLTAFLQKKYTFVVCDKNTISRLKKALSFFNKNDIQTTMGYKLGYEDETIQEIDLFGLDETSMDLTQPYVLLIQKCYENRALISEDSEFETERGMITKKYKRQLSLQNLDLLPNQTLWDIGAGSGSCGIEAFKRYKVKTIFFEKNPTRIEYIKSNLTSHHVVDCELYEGEATDYFNSIEETPQRIFVGGGGEKVIEQLPFLYERLDDKGIMLINAITLKHLSQMINVLNEAQIEFETHSISLTTYKGKLDLVEPERQLFQLKICKEANK